jgi:predicted nucleic acid-binding protein
VLDASVVLGAFLPDERHEESIVLFFPKKDVAFHAPEIWRAETGNGLLMTTRRNRLSIASLDRVLEELSALVVTIDSLTGHHAWNDTMALALKHRLTLYDACYLELAKRLGAQLATLDGRLAAAAELEDVELAL